MFCKKCFWFVGVVVSGLVFGAPPRVMNYQGKLTDRSGAAINGTHMMTFRIYDADTGGHLLWYQTKVVNVVKGLFSVELDLSINGGDTLKFDRPYWISVQVDGEPEMTPREKLVAVGYAFSAIYSDTARYVIGSGMGGYIWNQDTVCQEGNFRINGVGSQGMIHIAPTTPDTFLPQPGMIRTTGFGGEYRVYTYDGICWREWFPEIDTVSCYGGSLFVETGDDTTMCIGFSVDLDAEVSGGWPPYDYDWDNDGVGDWDDPSEISVSPSDTTIYHIRVRDAVGAIAEDSVVVNPIVCAFANAVGGAGVDKGYSVSNTTDGGYITAGYTKSFGTGGEDLLVVKFDARGLMQWTLTTGGSGDERGNSVIQTEDGGYVIAGYTSSFGAGGKDVFLVKMDSLHSIQWTCAVGGTQDDCANSVIQTVDGGYVVVGYTESFGHGREDVFVVKFDSMGSVESAWAVGDTGNECGNSVVQTADSGYVVAGYGIGLPSSAGSADLFLFKLNPTPSDSGASVVEWAYTVGTGDYDAGNSLVKATGGGYVIAGLVRVDTLRKYDLLLVKFNREVADCIEWARIVGGPPADERGMSVDRTSDGGYVVTGDTYSYGEGQKDLFLVKFDSEGSEEWAYVVGGTGYDYGEDVVQTVGGGYVAVGYTSSFELGSYDELLVRFEPDGRSCTGEFVFPSVEDITLTCRSQSPGVVRVVPEVERISLESSLPDPTFTEICP